ncbi:DUF2975 domain-containing protein [Streptomyces sp. MNU76]|uniref:DUF2975 domain-containing protein n=1 Tax=Streptomyces sp. MNU76 TaxID=2560026 RepID=UPI001E50F726|nr:DUF2975 domain-containing protein [Streptomyces sp. MNU76]MCC9709650.1 DUF2975 domain-containing protein [Streptomyces sp. MNU76]
MGMLNRPSGRQDPLEPIEFAVTLVCAVAAGLLALLVLASLVLDDASLWFFDMPAVCVTDTAMSGSSSALDGAFGSYPGVSITVNGPQFCLDDPSAGQRALHLAGLTTSWGWNAGAFVFALLLIRRARSHGPFTKRTARGLNAFGWYLAAGAAVLHVGGAVVGGLLLRDMTEYWPFAMLLDPGHVPWAALFTGIGLITFARLMRLATAMREDLEGVV